MSVGVAQFMPSSWHMVGLRGRWPSIAFLRLRVWAVFSRSRPYHATPAPVASLFRSRMDILLIFLLILVNGLFAMSEIAIVSARRSRLVQLADEGDLGARAALAISEHPTRFLSTVQIGITMIGVLSGAFGEAAITRRLIPVFEGVGLLAPYAKPLATACMVISITYVSIVVGEITDCP